MTPGAPLAALAGPNPWRRSAVDAANAFSLFAHITLFSLTPGSYIAD